MIVGTWIRWVAFAALASSVVACVIDTEPVHRHDRRGSSGGTYPPAPAASGSSPTAPSPASEPILVSVDTDRTMDANPGEGVGIFTEYKSGGHWHVWWTCDTNQTQEVCPVDLRVRYEGRLEDVTGDQLLDTDTISSSVDGREAHVLSTTSTNVAGLFFDTAPGAIIELEGTIGRISDPGFFFFVQDGKVNGGFDGALTNPLRFHGTKP